MFVSKHLYYVKRNKKLKTGQIYPNISSARLPLVLSTFFFDGTYLLLAYATCHTSHTHFDHESAQITDHSLNMKLTLYSMKPLKSFFTL
jgi:hypothetical protein